MRKASTRTLEQGIQAPSPAPDLIPAETSTENLHWDWYNERGHVTSVAVLCRQLGGFYLVSSRVEPTLRQELHGAGCFPAAMSSVGSPQPRDRPLTGISH
jgi:hypothetical protein